MTTNQLIDQLVTQGGAIVTSGECSEMEIADAQATGRFSVREDGIGFVRRYAEWLALQLEREEAGRDYAQDRTTESIMENAPQEKAGGDCPRTPCSPSWDYCPECGSRKHAHFCGYAETHRYCLDCDQEWHSDIDYSDVVKGNLRKAIAEIKRLRAISIQENAIGEARADNATPNHEKTL